MKLAIAKASTDQTVNVFIQDSSSSTGGGLTGLVYNTASLVCYYVRAKAAAVQLSLATQTVTGAHSDGGFVEISAANMPGWYRLDLSDVICATGVDHVGLMLKGATNMAPTPLEIQLTTLDFNTVMRGTDSAATAAALTTHDDRLSGLVLNQTTIATLASQISFTLTAGSTDDDAYNGCLAVIEDASTSEQKAVGLIINYAGGSKTITLAIDPAVFTMAVSDKITILATATSSTVWDRILSGATHNIPSSAGRRLRGVQAFGDYANGALWFDSADGVGGQVAYENATVQNPSNSMADVLAIAASLKMKRIMIAPGSAITLGAALENMFVAGASWTLDLNGYSISGSTFVDADVTGIGTGASRPNFIGGHLEDVTLPPCHCAAVGLVGTFTVGSAGTFFFDGQCHDMEAGASNPVFDFGSGLNASTVNLNGYLGGLEIQNMGAGSGSYAMSLKGKGHFVINANCSATSNVVIHGAFDLTDNASGAVTVVDTSRYAQEQIADAVWDEILTAAAHNIATSAGRRLRAFEPTVYANGALWFDSENGAAGTANYENATVQNPSNTIADLLTIAASLGYTRIMVAPGSTLTLAAALDGFCVEGANWSLELGGQSISGSAFFGAAVSGTSTGALSPKFTMCEFGDVTIPPSHNTWCNLGGTFTAAAAGNYFFDLCHSAIAGVVAPVFDFGSGLNASNVNLRNYSGGWHVHNMGAGSGTYNMSVEGRGNLIINANCSATSIIAVRGPFTKTDNSGGTVTFSEDARLDKNQILDALVDDSTQFSGGDIDAAITTRSSHNAAAAATAVLAATIDGAVDLETALKRINAVSGGGTLVITGTDPLTFAYKNVAGDTTVVSFTVPAAGTGRTRTG